MRTALLLTTLAYLFPAIAHAAGWRFQKQEDALTEEVIATASISNTELEQGVVIRCTGRKLEAYVNTGTYLGSEMLEVKYRVDKNPLRTESWMPSADGTAVFASEEREFSRALSTGSKFVLEAIDFHGQAHRVTFDLVGASAAITPVLKACGVDAEGMTSKVPGLRREVANDLERWGPQNISVNKEILAANHRYAGPLNSIIEPEFALAVQAYYDEYIEKCRAHEISGIHCDTMQMFWRVHHEPVMPPVGSVIYEASAGELKERAGKLKIGD